MIIDLSDRRNAESAKSRLSSSAQADDPALTAIENRQTAVITGCPLARRLRGHDTEERAQT
jgi:hypothetical protein